MEVGAAFPPTASARRHRSADIRDTRKRFAISRSLAPFLGQLRRGQPHPLRARSAAVSPPPSGYLMVLALRTTGHLCHRILSRRQVAVLSGVGSVSVARPYAAARLARVNAEWRAVLTEAFDQPRRELGIPLPLEALVSLVMTFNLGIIVERLGGIQTGHPELLDWIEQWISR